MSDLDGNIARLQPHLDRAARDGVLNRIAGQVRPAASGRTFANHSPVDESHICDVARSGAEDIDAVLAFSARRI